MKKDCKVSITATKGLNRLQFESKVVEAVKEGLLIEQLMFDNMVLDFNVSPLVLLNAVIIDENDRPYEWKNVEIHYVEYKGNHYNMIITKEDGQVINRRAGYRVFLGFKGVAQIGHNKAAHDVVVKDISEFGVAFVCNKDAEVGTDNTVRIVFQDDKTSQRFVINATVVRKVVLEENKILYGCKLAAKSNELRKYINSKQLDSLQKRNIKKFLK